VFTSNASQILTYLDDHENELPCLIILDYNMPGLNGAEILKELSLVNKYNDIPKIIWSTSRSNTYRDTCLELGAIDYIVKPSRMKDLISVVRYMLSYTIAG
jgi:DNA-binding response OmpR family regulator